MTIALSLTTRRRRRRSQSGITLVEIMVVLVIIALIATGVTVAVLPAIGRARVKETISRCATIRSAALMYVIDNPSQCPTVEQLVEGRFLDTGKATTDAWDKPISIQCEALDVTAISGGPDLQIGTEDDIR